MDQKYDRWARECGVWLSGIFDNLTQPLDDHTTVFIFQFSVYI